MVDVRGTWQFEAWYVDLTAADAKAVDYVVGLLEAYGVTLTEPYSKAIVDANFALRELRVQGRPLRVFYAFDPKRQAILLLGGSKAGKERRFYKQMIPLAEKAWIEYLEKIDEGD